MNTTEFRVIALLTEVSVRGSQEKSAAPQSVPCLTGASGARAEAPASGPEMLERYPVVFSCVGCGARPSLPSVPYVRKQVRVCVVVSRRRVLGACRV